MTIGMNLMLVQLIQAVGQVYQAAHASPIVSATMMSTGDGGLLQSIILLIPVGHVV